MELTVRQSSICPQFLPQYRLMKMVDHTVIVCLRRLLMQPPNQWGKFISRLFDRKIIYQQVHRIWLLCHIKYSKMIIFCYPCSISVSIWRMIRFCALHYIQVGWKLIWVDRMHHWPLKRAAAKWPRPFLAWMSHTTVDSSNMMERNWSGSFIAKEEFQQQYILFTTEFLKKNRINLDCLNSRKIWENSVFRDENKDIKNPNSTTWTCIHISNWLE